MKLLDKNGVEITEGCWIKYENGKPLKVIRNPDFGKKPYYPELVQVGALSYAHIRAKEVEVVKLKLA